MNRIWHRCIVAAILTLVGHAAFETRIEPTVAQVARPGQTFVVTTTTDGNGAGTLRTAITSANSNPGADTITFNIPGSGTQTMPITSNLPVITDPVTIDGTTQPGYSGTPLIRFTPGVGGLNSLINITGGNSTIKALSFASFSGITTNNGMIVLASNNNVVAACHSGTGSGNTQVYITGANNLVGGTTTADRNYFYGNTSGRENVIIRGIAATGNRVTGNVFGTTPAGARQTNSGKHILIEDAPGNFVGGTVGTTPGGSCTGECNVLSGSDNDAIAIFGTGSTGNTVAGNYIGLMADGLNVNRNANYGVHIQNASNNTIGGNTSAARNVVAANSFGQIWVESGTGNVITANYIGLKANGSEAVTGTFNVPAFGVQLNSNNNRIGGLTPGERNIISGSNRGVIISGNSNLIQGNYIGTDATGSFALTTQLDGVLITGANNTIGGTAGTTPRGACTGACNVISGNARNGPNNGLVISGLPATGNIVDGNVIGLNAAASQPIFNGDPALGGRAILVIGAGGNTIGRLPESGPPPAPASEVPANDWCVQDDVTGSFVVYDDGTPPRIIMAQDCRTGHHGESGPAEDRLLNDGSHKIVGKGVTVTRTGSSATAKFGEYSYTGQPFWSTEIKDSNTSDNPLPCRCPLSAEQAVTGTIELAAQTATEPNTVARNLLYRAWFNGTAVPFNSSVIQSPVWESDEGLAKFLNNEIDINGWPPIKIGHNVYARGNRIATTSNVNLISSGNTPTLQLRVKQLANGEMNVFGSITASPNQTWRLELFSQDLSNMTVNNTISAAPLGIEFDVTTNSVGQGTFDKVYSGTDAGAIRSSDYLSATASLYASPGTFQGTSEMSAKARVPEARGDFDYDGKTDPAVFRAGSTASSFSYWFVYQTATNTANLVQFGNGEDKPLAGAFSGDRTNSFAVWRPSTNVFYHSKLTGNPTTDFVGGQWGVAGDIRVTGDVDGDGFSEIGVYRNGEWWMLASSTQFPVIQFGLAGDKPVLGDYNGDGRDELAVFRSGVWYILPCPTCVVTYANWGLSGDIPVPEDYDGDGRTDVAVWRPSTGVWYIQQSTDGFLAIQWGISTDIPVYGDFDGDGKNDIAIFRPATGDWWIRLSSTGATYVLHWGQNGDRPITAFPNVPG